MPALFRGKSSYLTTIFSYRAMGSSCQPSRTMGFLAAAGRAFVLSGLAFYSVVYSLAYLVEMRRPIRASLPRSELMLDASYAACSMLIGYSWVPVVGAMIVSVFGSISGAGAIHLSNRSAWWFSSLAIYLIARDLLEFVWHRLQHSVPLLWSMHSFHHSEESMNAMTAHRQYWFENFLKAVFIYPTIGILFRVPPGVLAAGLLIDAIHPVFAHMNLKISLGRFSYVIAGPQYHRIHHSIEPRHLEKNFAQLFPMWDILSGTAYRPADQEFPDTGLSPSKRPSGLTAALLWAIR